MITLKIDQSPRIFATLADAAEHVRAQFYVPYRERKRAAMEARLRLGQALLALRNVTPVGRWDGLLWEAGIHARVARRAMQVAQNVAERGVDLKGVGSTYQLERVTGVRSVRVEPVNGPVPVLKPIGMKDFLAAQAAAGSNAHLGAVASSDLSPTLSPAGGSTPRPPANLAAAAGTRPGEEGLDDVDLVDRRIEEAVREGRIKADPAALLADSGDDWDDHGQNDEGEDDDEGDDDTGAGLSVAVGVGGRVDDTGLPKSIAQRGPAEQQTFDRLYAQAEVVRRTAGLIMQGQLDDADVLAIVEACERARRKDVAHGPARTVSALDVQVNPPAGTEPRRGA